MRRGAFVPCWRDAGHVRRRQRPARPRRSGRPAGCRCRASSASSPTRSTCASGPPRPRRQLGLQRAGLPVEITAEFENWRRIRDWEGAEGWVYHSLLSGRRTALVSPQSKGKDELMPLHDKPDAASARHREAAERRARHGEALQRRLVPPRRRRASTAGSSRSACGASIRTRRWMTLDAVAHRRRHRPARTKCRGHDGRPSKRTDGWRSQLRQSFLRSRTTTSTRAIS